MPSLSGKGIVGRELIVFDRDQAGVPVPDAQHEAIVPGHHPDLRVSSSDR
jgi:hypothetical protein